MKVLFFNKYDTTGGAAIVATRLHQALQEQFRTEDRFIVGVKHSKETNVFCSRRHSTGVVIERGLNYMLNRAGIQYCWLPISTPEIRRRTVEFRPDVISLHNIHGGYFDTSLLVELSRIAPIVWTLHDMWSFTGNAAHTFGDASWKEMRSARGEHKMFPSIGIPTGRWLLQRKKNIYAKSNLTIVTPSQWLNDLAVQSPVFEHKRILHIPNGIDTNRYRPLEKNETRDNIGIPREARVIYFSSEKIGTSDYKGGPMLLEILHALHTQLQEDVHLIMLGGGELKGLSAMNRFVVHRAGYIHSETDMIKYINAADLLLYPTKADNFPNVLVESIACGVPCVTFDIGGCREIILDGENGFLVQPFEVRIFSERIQLLLNNKMLRNKLSVRGREIAVEKYSLRKMGEEYYRLFNELHSSFNRSLPVQ